MDKVLADRAGRVAALVLLIGLLMPSIAAAAQEADPPRNYLGGAWPPNYLESPTRYEPQSKLWFHDGAWWALMTDPSSPTARVYELRPDHTWRATTAVANLGAAGVGDALADGDVLYTLSRSFDTTLRFTRFSYDKLRREYVSTSGPPSVVTRAGALSPASLAKDTSGRLWVAFTTYSEVRVAHSDTDGNTWSRTFAPAVPGTIGIQAHETAAIVAFDDKVGVMWSDQRAQAFRFAVHRAGAPDSEWSLETPLAGPSMADNHINIKTVDREPADVLVATVKTSAGEPGAPPGLPLIAVLKRSPTGQWLAETAGTVSEAHNSPMVQVDEATDAVYLFATVGGTIFMKRSALDDLSFPPGLGEPFVVPERGALVDAAGSKQPVNADTGIVVVASNQTNRTYQHAEMAIGNGQPADAGDATAPSSPARLWAESGASGLVSLEWSPSTDGNRWSPAAAAGAPAHGYVVYRNGNEVGTTTRATFGDSPPGPGVYQYSVVALDRGGNRSEPATTPVAVAPEGWNVVRVVVLSLLALALAVAVAFGVRYHRRARQDFSG